jgi:5-bromo-4-chloroindolyl phosphate hydrolysis protein
MNRDWERFGEDILRTVQDAVDSQDFNRLNQTITNSVNGAMNGLGRGLSNAGRAARDTYRYQKRAERDRYRKAKRRGSHIYKEDESQYSGDGNTGEYGDGWKAYGSKYQSGERTPDFPDLYRENSLFIKTSGAKAGGVAMSVTGYFLGISMFLLFAFLLIGTTLTSYFVTWVQIIMGAAAVFFAGGMLLGGFGTALLKRVKRFRNYIQELEGKDYCEIKELAGSLKKSHKYVVKDIEKMIQRGWFREGHLDRQKTCLIVSDKAYEQYTALMTNIEKRKQEEKIAKVQQEEKQQNTDPKVQEIVRAGDEYIKKIRMCNDAIPGEEISAKIYRIEMLVDRIFDRVEQNPENISDIRRLMDYYLPTTVKLLEAYEQLDNQPVQGENILSSKMEIEKTLDTLNIAFEKLLDSLFKDTAWDVSSDISVLNTILAQEGLTKDDF